MSKTYLEKDGDSIYEEYQFENSEDTREEEEYREDRMDQMISRYGYWGGPMAKQKLKEQELLKHEDFEHFAKYLGLDYEDYYEFILCDKFYDVEFDDYSK